MLVLDEERAETRDEKEDDMFATGDERAIKIADKGSVQRFKVSREGPRLPFKASGGSEGGSSIRDGRSQRHFGLLAFPHMKCHILQE